jgi:hypothetical protein
MSSVSAGILRHQHRTSGGKPAAQGNEDVVERPAGRHRSDRIGAKPAHEPGIDKLVQCLRKTRGRDRPRHPQQHPKQWPLCHRDTSVRSAGHQS